MSDAMEAVRAMEDELSATKLRLEGVLRCIDRALIRATTVPPPGFEHLWELTRTTALGELAEDSPEVRHKFVVQWALSDVRTILETAGADAKRWHKEHAQ